MQQSCAAIAITLNQPWRRLLARFQSAERRRTPEPPGDGRAYKRRNSAENGRRRLMTWAGRRALDFRVSPAR